MSNQATATAQENENENETVVEDEPKSLAVAKKGVRTTKDFNRLISALMCDVITGDISPIQANACCNLAIMARYSKSRKKLLKTLDRIGL